MIHSILRSDEVIVTLGGFPYVVSVEDDRYEDVMDAIEDGDEEALENLLSMHAKSVRIYDELEEDGIVSTSDGTFEFKGQKVAMDLASYLEAAMDTGRSVAPIVNFIKRLYENPSHDTRQRLFSFMEANKLPLSDDGCFLAYKVVRDDYRDKHTGSVYNGVGVTLPRLSWSEVDTDPDRTCSYGYHACSREYLDSFYSAGDRVVAVEIAPEDVGAIPSDYNNSKLRCRQYTVVSDITDQYAREQDKIAMSIGDLNPNQRSRERYHFAERDRY